MHKAFRSIIAAALLAFTATGAYATSLQSESNVGFAAEPSRHSLYVKGGLLGVGMGYAYGINERFTVRGDFTTIGSYNRSGHVGHVDYDLKLRNDVATLSVDYFPFDSGFRLTGGLGLRDTTVSGNATATEFRDVPFDSSDALYAKVKWPTVAPYLGIGWGHNNAQYTKAGWGFIADLGVYIGKPSYSLRANDSAMAKLNAYSGGNGQAMLDAETREWEDKLNKFKLFPTAYVGVSYRF